MYVFIPGSNNRPLPQQMSGQQLDVAQISAAIKVQMSIFMILKQFSHAQ